MSLFLAAALAVQLTGPLPPPADAPGGVEASAGGIRLSVGVQELRHADSASGEIGLEVRLPWRILGILDPVMGLAMTSRASTFGYAGVALNLPMGSRVGVTPSFSTGLYSRGGGKDLNNAVQFRTGLRLAVRVHRGARFGVELVHLSSAGLANPNPGVEALVLVYEVPF